MSNCGAPLHREISGKAFTGALARIVNDRVGSFRFSQGQELMEEQNTHPDVKKRILSLIDGWVKEHGKDANFDM